MIPLAESALGTSYADYKPYYKIYLGISKELESGATITAEDGTTRVESQSIMSEREFGMKNPADVTDLLTDFVESIKVTHQRNKPSECNITFSYSLEDMRDEEKKTKVLAMLKVFNPNNSSRYRFVLEAGLRKSEQDLTTPSINNYSVRVYDLEQYKKKSKQAAPARPPGAGESVNATEDTLIAAAFNRGSADANNVQELLKNVETNVNPSIGENLFRAAAAPTLMYTNNEAILFTGQFQVPSFSGGPDGIVRGTSSASSVLALAVSTSPNMSSEIVSKITRTTRRGVTTAVRSEFTETGLRLGGGLLSVEGATNFNPNTSLKNLLDDFFYLTINETGRAEDIGNPIIDPPESRSSRTEAVLREAISSEINTSNTKNLEAYWKRIEATGLLFNTSALKNYSFIDVFGGLINTGDSFKKALNAMTRPNASIQESISQVCKALGIEYTMVPYRDTSDYSTPRSRFRESTKEFRLFIGSESTIIFHPKHLPILAGLRRGPATADIASPAIGLSYGDEVVDFKFQVNPSKIDVKKTSTSTAGAGANASGGLTIGVVVDGKWKVDFEISEEKIRQEATAALGRFDGTINAMDFFIDLAREDPDRFIAIFTKIPINSMNSLKITPVGPGGSTVSLDLTLRHPIPGLTTSAHIYFSSNNTNRPMVPPYLETMYYVEKIVHDLKAKDEIWTMSLTVQK